MPHQQLSIWIFIQRIEHVCNPLYIVNQLISKSYPPNFIDYHLRNMVKYFCENLQLCWNMRFFLLNNFCYIIQVIFRWSRNFAFTLTWRYYGEIFMFMIDYFFPFTCRINLFSKPFTRNNKYYSVLKVSCWQTGLEFNN